MENIIIQDEEVIKLLEKAREITNTTYKNNLDDILAALEEVIDAYEDVKDEIEDIKEDIEDNYKPISRAEEIGFNEMDLC